MNVVLAFVIKVLLLRRGHQLAAQMENTNPNFVENLRRTLVDPQPQGTQPNQQNTENKEDKEGDPDV